MYEMYQNSYGNLDDFNMTYFRYRSVHAIISRKNFSKKNAKKLKSSNLQHIVCLKNPNLKRFSKSRDIWKSELTRVSKANNAYFVILSQNPKCLEKCFHLGHEKTMVAPLGDEFLSWQASTVFQQFHSYISV